MDKDTLVKVRNRDSGAVLYSIPEMNGLLRTFQPKEVKEVPFEELKKLSYLPGGMALLKDSLVVQDDEAVAALLGEVEPEYSYTPEDIKKLLQEGTLDEVLDCLDFAPEGVTDLVKVIAVELPLNDVAKREAILNKTGFNVTNAINIKRETETETEKPAATPTRRRVQKEDGAEPAKKTRRVIKSE